ncbi:MAG: hypothetical protein GX552_18180 [Chloroflexi bacterium]|nr:hypothetical protein [Chloroflexota bacterium]
MNDRRVRGRAVSGGGTMREALFELLAGRIPEETVWTADLSYWIAGQLQLGEGDPAWNTEEGYLALHQQLGVMPYYWYAKFWLGEPEYGPEIELVADTKAGRTRRIWRTPIGELVQEEQFLPESCSTGCTKHAVESERDLDILLYLLEHRRLRVSAVDDYPQRMELWARYDGLPSIAMPRSPLPAFVYEWAGVQNAFFLLMDYPDKVETILTLMEEQEQPVLDAVCQLAPPLVHFADNLSSESLTTVYDNWIAGPHRRRLERLHAAGTKCAVHLDGTVRGLLPKLAAVGFDAVEALTPEPAGDLPVEEMRAVAGSDTLILWGGVPGVMFAPPYTWADMEAHLERVFDAWEGTPFILGVADQVPPDGDIAFCRRIAEFIQQRKYRS